MKFRTYDLSKAVLSLKYTDLNSYNSYFQHTPIRVNVNSNVVFVNLSNFIDHVTANPKEMQYPVVYHSSLAILYISFIQMRINVKE